MKRLLIAYATMAGSTAEIAETIGGELTVQGFAVEVKPVEAIAGLQSYDAVIIGAPMILGWHRAALRFLRRHRADFQSIPLATFITALSLTKTEVAGPADVPVFVDPELPEPPAVSGRLTLRERYARPSNYLRPILRSLKPAKPKSIGFFGGCLEYGRLPWWGVLFAMVILRIPAGDRRNWEAVQTWAQGLPAALGIKGGERSERGDSRS